MPFIITLRTKTIKAQVILCLLNKVKHIAAECARVKIKNLSMAVTFSFVVFYGYIIYLNNKDEKSLDREYLSKVEWVGGNFIF